MIDAIPTTLAIQPNAIPWELKEIPQWVAWRWVHRKDWTKPPVNPRTGGLASSTDHTTWGTFAQALSRAERYHLPGIGFMMTPAAEIIAVDLDKCVQDGQIASWAQEIINTFSSYTEVSPRGTGVHIFCRGTLSCKGRKVGIREIYQAERYMTVTGYRITTTPNSVNEAQAAADAFLASLGPVEDSVRAAWTPTPLPVGGLRERAEMALIRRTTLSLLDSTGQAHYASPSEADSAIACALIGAGFSPDETYTLIRESTRGQDMPRRKGDRHSDNYLRRTIAHAVTFATPASYFGMTTRPVSRASLYGSRNSQIHDNGDAPEEKREWA